CRSRTCSLRSSPLPSWCTSTSRSRGAPARAGFYRGLPDPLRSVFFFDPAAVLDGRLVVVGLRLVTTGQLDLFCRRSFVGNKAEEVGNEVQPRPPLVIGAHEIPRRKIGVGGLQHLVAGTGVVVPPLA